VKGKSKSQGRTISPDRFARSLEDGRTEPLYVFCGTQGHLIDKAVARLRDQLTQPFPELNFSLHWGEECDVARLLESLGSHPMYSPRRVAVVRNASRLSTEQLTLLEGYAADPPPAACLVLVYDERPRLPAALSSRAVTVDFSPGASDLAGLIEQEAERLGLDLTPAAARLMVTLVGEDLAAVAAELDKMASYFGPGTRVGTEEVRSVVEKREQGGLYDAVNALIKRDRAAALASLMELEARGMEPLYVAAAITRRVRLLLKAKEAEASGMNGAQAARELGVSPGAWRHIRAEHKRFSTAELVAAMERLERLDAALKSSYVPREHHLVKLVLEFTGG